MVPSEPERRWNERLKAAGDIETEIDQLEAGAGQPLSREDKMRLMSRGEDINKAWDSPGVTPETRKKTIRTVISEIIVDVVGDTIEMVVHWEGGDHTKMSVKRSRVGQTRRCNDAEVIDLVGALFRHMPDEAIAAVLNRSGKLTGYGNTFTRTRVSSIRRQKEIAMYRPGERADRAGVTLKEAATELNVSPSTARRHINSGVLPATQL